MQIFFFLEDDLSVCDLSGKYLPGIVLLSNHKPCRTRSDTDMRKFYRLITVYKSAWVYVDVVSTRVRDK